MRHFLPILLLAFLGGDAPSAAGEAAGTTPRRVDHVVLISIDGLRPEFYLDPAWPAPMLQQMAREGVSAAAARSVYPSVTYPAHTTIVTGALPSRHGVVYNSPFEPGGATGRWYWEAAAIQVPTLWDAARAAGLTTANLSWPVSVGAPIDWNLPEIWSLDPARSAIDALRAASTPVGLWEEIEREATGRLTMENFYIDRITRDDRAGDIAAYLFASRRPALLTVHLLEVDHFQHEDGRDSPRVRRALSAADSAISQVVEAVERLGLLERTAVLVTGDHGFVDVRRRLAPNVWLADAGLRGRGADHGDWRATFHTAAASAFLHLRDPADGEALARVRELLASLPAEERQLFDVLDRAALDGLGAADEAVLGLALAPGVDASSTAEPPAVRPHTGGNHGYLPHLPQLETGFVAWGAGLPAAARIEEIGLEDITPVVARLLGLDFDAPDGELPAIFRAP